MSRLELTLPIRGSREPIVILHLAGRTGVVVPVAFLVDTGSPVSLLTVATAQTMGIDYDSIEVKQQSLEAIGGRTGFGKTRLAQVPLHLGFLDEQGNRTFVALTLGGVADIRRNILGRDFIGHFRFTWENDYIRLSPKEANL